MTTPGTPRKTLTARIGEDVISFPVRSVLRFRADDKYVMADLADGRSLYLHRSSTIKALGAEFKATFVTCNPGLMVPRAFLLHYEQGAYGTVGGWLRVAGSADLIKVTDTYRLEVAEATTLQRIASAVAHAIAQVSPPEPRPRPIVTDEDAYAAGRDARLRDKPNTPPANLCRKRAGWWSAGWNDTDLEREEQA